MNNQPDVSIIVPVYNSKTYLEECKNSLTGQTYRNIEIIFVDDGSPDESGQMCDFYSKEDSRIRVIHQKNQGIYYARQTGLNASLGQYIMFCDADDLYEKNAVEILINLIKKHNADLVYAKRVNLLYKNKQIVSKSFQEGEAEIEITDKKNEELFLSALWSCLFKKDILIKAYTIPFGPRTYEDCPVFMKYIALCNNRVVIYNQPLYSWRQRRSSFSHIRVSKIEDILQIKEYMFQNLLQSISCNQDLLRKRQNILISGFWYELIEPVTFSINPKKEKNKIENNLGQYSYNSLNTPVKLKIKKYFFYKEKFHLLKVFFFLNHVIKKFNFNLFP